jgi:hypothetical protein
MGEGMSNVMGRMLSWEGTSASNAYICVASTRPKFLMEVRARKLLFVGSAQHTVLDVFSERECLLYLGLISQISILCMGGRQLGRHSGVAM